VQAATAIRSRRIVAARGRGAALGLDELERRVGEDRVVTPGREQLVLPGGFLVQVADPALNHL
jgi:hypothetical protein